VSPYVGQVAYNPRVADGTEQDNTVRFLLEGAYMTYIRDNAVEDDALMSGGAYTNTGMVVTIEGVIARLQAMPDGSAADGSAHNKVFKWAYDKAGSVVVRDSIFYLEEVSEGSSSNLPFPEGSTRTSLSCWDPGSTRMATGTSPIWTIPWPCRWASPSHATSRSSPRRAKRGWRHTVTSDRQELRALADGSDQGLVAFRRLRVGQPWNGTGTVLGRPTPMYVNPADRTTSGSKKFRPSRSSGVRMSPSAGEDPGPRTRATP
jgi:hypothetical protein